MLRKMTSISLIVLTILSFGKAFGHGGGGKLKKIVGPGKAIVEFDENKGVKFSKEAMSSLELKLGELKNTKSFRIPDDALIRDKDHHGVYIFKDGFFRLVHVEVLETFEGGRDFFVRPKSEIAPGAKLLERNANLVHVSVIYLKHT